MIAGIDLSEHQSATPSLDGLGFVVLRASIAGRKDTRYDQHAAAARQAGLVVMAYHYGYPAETTPIADQVRVFLATAAGADFLWLDQEQTGFTDAEAQAFIDAVRVERPIGLYHSVSGFGGVSSDAKWVADWRDASVAAGYPRNTDGTREFPAWDLWQYNGGGADGIDNDYANPARPLAGLLRLGYVPKQDYDAKVAALALAESEIAALSDDLAEKVADVVHLTEDNLALQASLDAAPGIERERIALAEAGRIRAL